MRRHWWRFLVTALLVGALCPMTATMPAGASPAAPAAPTFNCPTGTSPRICAVIQIAEDAYIIGGLTAVTGLDFGGALAALGSIAELRALGYGGVMDYADLDPCDQPWWDNSSCTSPQATKENVKKALAFWAELAQDVKEASKLDEACEFIGWWLECGVPDGELEGNESFSGYPGGAEYSGPLYAIDWHHDLHTEGSAVAMVIPTDDGDAQYLQWTWVGGSYYVQVQQDVAGTVPNQTVAYRLCVKTPSIFIDCSDWTDTQPAGSENIGALAVRTNGTLGGAPTYYTPLQIIVPGSSPLEWSMQANMWGYFGSRVSANSDYRATYGGDGDYLEVFAQWYASATVEGLVEKLGRFDPGSPAPTEEGELVEVPPRPGTEELPTPTTEAQPSTVTTAAPPTAPTIPADPSGTHEEQQTGLLQQIKSGITSGFNWLGDKLGGLLTWIGDRIMWLGDIFGYWIRWLWERVKGALELLRAAINSLTDLLVWVLTQVRDLLADIGEAIGQLLRAIWELPALIGEGIITAIQTALEFLFVPETATLTGLRDSCATAFPCSWVDEGASAVTAFGSGVADAAGGACVAPTIGWDGNESIDGFRVSFPPPDGCAVGPGSAPFTDDENAGDLFGWRLVLRGAFLLAFSLAFIRHIIKMTPWWRNGERFFAGEGSEEQFEAWLYR